MKLDKTKQGDVMVVTPHGWSSDLDTRMGFKDELLGLVDNGETAILVDMSDVDYLTSAGLGTLLSAARRLKEINGKFAVCSLGDNVMKVFEISGFTTIIDIYPSVDQALAGLK